MNNEFEFNYKLNKIVESVENLENVIKTNFSFEKFIFKLSFENTYNSNESIVRFSLSNTVGNTYENNGLITLYHKYFNLNEFKLSENEILLLFFEIQKNLNEKFDFKYEISDSRKENKN